MFYFVLWLSLATSIINGLPIDINPNNANNITFKLNLPNNEVVEVGLTFKMLTYTHLETPNTNTSSSSSTTESSDDQNSVTEAPTLEKNLVTVGEAIEAFRQKLLRKEADIGGVIESSEIFYRHFRFEFTDQLNQKELRVRCSYLSDFENRRLNIDCLQYHEVGAERLLSSGEIEVFDPTSHHSDVEIINMNALKQTYNMDIF